MTYLEEYARKVLSGEITACHRIKQVCALLLDKLVHPGKYDPWVFDEKITAKPIDFIEAFCKQAQGKMGTPIKLELFQKAKFQAIFGFVHKETRFRQYNECLTIEGRKNGKALALDTSVPTPNGWTTMGDLTVGDVVFGVDGNPARITAVSDVFYHHDCYQVTFEDGEEIIADADHVWTVMTKKSRAATRKKCKRTGWNYKHEYRENNGYFNVTTCQMAGGYFYERRDGKGIEYKYRVPMPKAVQYNEDNLLISPYVLGVWLGNGYSKSTCITSSDQDVEEMTANIIAEGYTVKVTKCTDSRASTIAVGVVGKGKSNRLLNHLRHYNLINNKHIPKDYLFASIEQRYELLRGLMDTDGYCEKQGQCEFSQKSKALVEGFSEILSSLGIKHTIREKYIMCNDKKCHAYSVLFFCSKNNSCFKLQRKHARLKDALAPRMLNKSIVNIEQVDSVPTKCITVDSDKHLYLAGKRMTATHNSSESAAVNLFLLMGDGEGAPEIYNIARLVAM